MPVTLDNLSEASCGNEGITELVRLFTKYTQKTPNSPSSSNNSEFQLISSPPATNNSTRNNTEDEEEDKKPSPSFKPKDTRLEPIADDLASQLYLYWPMLECIATRALDLTKSSFDIESKLKRWDTSFNGHDNQNSEALNASITGFQASNFYSWQS